MTDGHGGNDGDKPAEGIRLKLMRGCDENNNSSDLFYGATETERETLKWLLKEEKCWSTAAAIVRQ